MNTCVCHRLIEQREENGEDFCSATHEVCNSLVGPHPTDAELEDCEELQWSCVCPVCGDVKCGDCV